MHKQSQIIITKILVALALLSYVSLNASDESTNSIKPLYSFMNTSVNYLDWDNSTENKTFHEDFSYLEVEGGAGWKWGEFYGFIDIENPTKSYNDKGPDNLRVAAKPILDIYLINGLALHIQDYYLTSENFYVNDIFTGLSYKYNSDFGLWIKLFIDTHYQNSTYYDGFNGYMAGWVFNYDFVLFKQKFSILQWHEIEFNRDKKYYQLDDGSTVGDGKSYGTNGALSAWWHINEKFTTGVQYRYADSKLGFNVYQSAIIYSLKYYF
ncbi:MAG: hypothetical protein ACJAWW_000298 [Sulfurimonas sp.]|jgi:hypothetical protein